MILTVDCESNFTPTSITCTLDGNPYDCEFPCDVSLSQIIHNVMAMVKFRSKTARLLLHCDAYT